MKRILTWCCDYWWIPALVAAGVGISLFGRRAVQLAFGHSLSDRVKIELEAITAKREVREIEQREDHEAAVRHVRAKYVHERLRLNKAEQRRARELKDNPKALVKLLIKHGR